MSRIGVLVMSYGSPAHLGEVAAYYTDIRRGRPPNEAELAELVGRYEAIGGVSPLRQRTASQVDALARALDDGEPGRFAVAEGTRHARPSIEDGVAALDKAGVDRIVGLVLAPHFSSLSVGAYADRARRAACSAQRPLSVGTVPQWHLHPGLVGLLAERVTEAQQRAALATGDGKAPSDVAVVFTAHSLPARILADGDPYPTQLDESARAIAAAAGVRHWRLAWQSAGRTAEEWLGPDVKTVVGELARDGMRACVVCPQGFVSDHLEVLYDIDVDLRRSAGKSGIHVERTTSLNDDPAFVAVLCDVVLSAARKEDSGQ